MGNNLIKNYFYEKKPPEKWLFRSLLKEYYLIYPFQIILAINNQGDNLKHKQSYNKVRALLGKQFACELFNLILWRPSWIFGGHFGLTMRNF